MRARDSVIAAGAGVVLLGLGILGCSKKPGSEEWTAKTPPPASPSAEPPARRDDSESIADTAEAPAGDESGAFAESPDAILSTDPDDFSDPAPMESDPDEPVPMPAPMDPDMLEAGPPVPEDPDPHLPPLTPDPPINEPPPTPPPAAP